jgi:hypothetical protein
MFFLERAGRLVLPLIGMSKEIVTKPIDYAHNLKKKQPPRDEKAAFLYNLLTLST